MLSSLNTTRRDERGIAMIVAMFAVVLMAGAVLTIAVSVSGSGPLGQRDQARKAASTAADTALNLYVQALMRDSTFWSRCNNGTTNFDGSIGDAITAQTNGSFWNGSGTDPRRWYRPDPSANYHFKIEVALPAGQNSCGGDGTLTGPQPASLQVRVTAQSLANGIAEGPIRTERANLTRASLTDNLWVTDYETLAPALLERAPGFAGAYTKLPENRPTGGGANQESISDWGRTACAKQAYTTNGGLRTSLSYAGMRRSAASSNVVEYGPWIKRYEGTDQKYGTFLFIFGSWADMPSDVRVNAAGASFSAPNQKASSDKPWTMANMSQYGSGSDQWGDGSTAGNPYIETRTSGSGFDLFAGLLGGLFGGVSKIKVAVWYSRDKTYVPVENLSPWATQFGSGGSKQEAIPPAKCWEIAHVASEYTAAGLNGPVRSNDSLRVCGNMPFGGKREDQILTAAPAPGYRGTAVNDTICWNASGTPKVNGVGATSSDTLGTWHSAADRIRIPTNNDALRNSVTDPTYVRTGLTYIDLNASGILFGKSTNGSGSVSWEASRKPYPAGGVIAVNAAANNCYTEYLSYVPDATIKYSSAYAPNNLVSREGCGIAVVSGTYSKSLTIATQHDIVIRGSVKRDTGAGAANAVLGLVANDWVRIAQLVTSAAQPACDQFLWSSTATGTDTTLSTGAGTGVANTTYNPTNIQIDASIVALTGSFMLDRWWCGSNLGTLTVNGSIIQRYHGPVHFERKNGSTTVKTGYAQKAYTYDSKLEQYQPPGYERLDIAAEGWTVRKHWEQVPGI